MPDCYWGAICSRKLYTDTEEIVHEIQGPIILNGIGEFATRPDLLSRAVIIPLETIKINERKTAKEVAKNFEKNKSQIFGMLLDLMVGGLTPRLKIELKNLPRMADFAQWVVAIETGCTHSGWKPGEFMADYTGNIETASQIGLEASPLVSLLYELLSKMANTFYGTVSELLNLLQLKIASDQGGLRILPKTPNGLSSLLHRLAPALRNDGIEITFLPRNKKSRLIQIISKNRNNSVMGDGGNDPVTTTDF